jgi:hypothetical protein
MASQNLDGMISIGGRCWSFPLISHRNLRAVRSRRSSEVAAKYLNETSLVESTFNRRI